MVFEKLGCTNESFPALVEFLKDLSNKCEQENTIFVFDLFLACEEELKILRLKASEAGELQTFSIDSPLAQQLEIIICIVDVCSVYLSGITDHHNALGTLSVLLPKVIPNVFTECFVFCSSLQKNFSSEALEEVEDVILEIFTKAVGMFDVYRKLVHVHVIDGQETVVRNPADIDTILSSVARLAVPLAEIDTKWGLAASELLSALFTKVKDSLDRTFKPTDVWKHIANIVEIILEKLFVQADFAELDEENRREIGASIRTLEFVLRVFLDVEALTAKTLSKPEIEPVISLVASLYRYSPSILHMNDIPKSVIDVFERKVFIACPSLLEPVRHLPETVEIIWETLKSNDSGSSGAFSSLLLSMLLVDPAHSKMIDDKSGMLQQLLCKMDRCHRELVLSGGVMSKQLPGEPVAYLPVYEVIVTQIQAFVTTLLPDEVEPVVATLYRAVQNFGWSGLAASDVIVFMARYGSNAFCLQLFILTEKLLSGASPLTTPLYPRDLFLESLAIRLGRMLAPEDVAGMDYLVRVPLLDVPGEKFDRLMGSLVPVMDWTVDRLEMFISSCKCITYNAKVFSPDQTNEIVSMLLQSLQNFTIAYPLVMQDKGSIYLVSLSLVNVLRALGKLEVGTVEQETLSKILKNVREVAALENEEIDSAVIDFTASWLQSTIVSSPYQAEILQSHSKIFHCLFTTYSENATHASRILAKLLRTFVTYAEVTKHEQILPNCVTDTAHDLVTEFISADRKVERKEWFQLTDDAATTWQSSGVLFTQLEETVDQLRPGHVKLCEPEASESRVTLTVKAGENEQIEKCVGRIERELVVLNSALKVCAVLPNEIKVRLRNAHLKIGEIL